MLVAVPLDIRAWTKVTRRDKRSEYTLNAAPVGVYHIEPLPDGGYSLQVNWYMPRSETWGDSYWSNLGYTSTVRQGIRAAAVHYVGLSK